jgi:molybdopterin-biosynthesis enzyme MoeA-like protein
MQLLGAMYEKRGVEFNEARQRMARMPEGAVHIENAVSTAPGFHIGNVYVMAGVPQVFTAMLGTVVPQLAGGKPMLSRSVASPFGEGDIGSALAAIQKNHPDTSIGSYPRFSENQFSTEIVIRSREEAPAEAAERDIMAMIAEIAAAKAAS